MKNSPDSQWRIPVSTNPGLSRVHRPYHLEPFRLNRRGTSVWKGNESCIPAPALRFSAGERLLAVPREEGRCAGMMNRETKEFSAREGLAREGSCVAAPGRQVRERADSPAAADESVAADVATWDHFHRPERVPDGVIRRCPSAVVSFVFYRQVGV